MINTNLAPILHRFQAMATIRVKFVYEGHWVKVKVTRAKHMKIAIVQGKTLIGHHSGSVTHRAMRFACSVGFFTARPHCSQCRALY